MTQVPLDPLQTFVMAARTRNLTRAAERMHLTVSALSHQIRGLEERVGCSLFVRSSRGLKLTAVGQRLFVKVAPHLDAVAEALLPLCARDDASLSLSIVPSMTTGWLLPRLLRFVALHPGVRLNLDSSVALIDFADGRFDAALRYGTGDWPDVVVERLLDEWRTPVASPSLLAGRQRPRLEQLGDLPLLDFDDPWAAWFAKFGGRAPRRYAASFNDDEAVQRAAAEGLGVALGLVTMARPLLEAGQLVQLFPELMKSDKAYFLVYPERSRQHTSFMAFREWLREEAARFGAGPAAPRRRPSGRRTPA